MNLNKFDYRIMESMHHFLSDNALITEDELSEDDFERIDSSMSD